VESLFLFDIAFRDDFSIIEVSESVVDGYHGIVINSCNELNKFRYPRIQETLNSPLLFIYSPAKVFAASRMGL